MANTVVPYRVGLGYDVHPLVEGQALILGGVAIPCKRGLLGHSDGDVVCHALMDSILGACGLGDIGSLFPPEDQRYRGAASIGLLQEVVGKVRKEGWEIVNVDTMLIIEEPKIAPFVDLMKKRLSQAMEVDKERIGIKVTTNEGLGSIGRREGACCFAVSLLRRKEE